MREIKFRVWVENTLVDNDNYKIDLYGNLYYVDEFNHTNILIDEDYVIEQYTGLKDKNGAEIYEGDIVTFNDLRDDRKSFGVVKCDGGSCYIKNDFMSNYRLDDYKIEVVGNIHIDGINLLNELEHKE